jgi:hypothetical protein
MPIYVKGKFLGGSMKVTYCDECDETVEVFRDPIELGGSYFCCECGSTVNESDVEEVEDEFSG